MTVTTEHQTVPPVDRWQGIASFVIGATSIMFTLLLLGLATIGIEPPRPVMIALGVLSSLMLCGNLAGIAFSFFGARGPASRKLYPRFGLALNAANLMIFVALAFVG